MMCMEVHCEDGDGDLIGYGDQGVSTEEHDKAMYSESMKTQIEEEEEIKYEMTLCTNDSVSLVKKRRQLNENMPDKNVHDLSQSDVSLNDNYTGNAFNNEVTTVQGPMGDDKQIKLQKEWSMEMLTNNGNILTTMTNGLEEAREGYKKFLYTKAIHSNHMI